VRRHTVEQGFSDTVRMGFGARSGECQFKVATVVVAVDKRSIRPKDVAKSIKPSEVEHTLVQLLEHDTTLVLVSRWVRLVLDIEVLQHAGVVVDLEDPRVKRARGTVTL